MQVIYGPGLASNILFTAQKRLIRPAYSNTLAHPYAATLDPAFRNSDGSLNVNPVNVAAATRTTTSIVYTLNGSIVPGTVMVKSQTAGEYVNVANGNQNTSSEVPFGLLGQWIGGTFDNMGQNNQVGVWQGYDSVYELLAPAWDDTNLAAAIVTASATGAPAYMCAGLDGRLTLSTNTGANANFKVCKVLDRPSASRLLVQLIV